MTRLPSLRTAGSWSLVSLALATALGCSVLLEGCSDPRGSMSDGPMTFAPDQAASGSVVFMRGHTEVLAGNRLVVDVVARGAPELHGAAFRVTWDPNALAFVEAKHGPDWSKTSLAKAKEGTPGQLAVLWSEQGQASIDASQETVIGTLTFEAKAGTTSPLAFKVERSQLVDKMGVRVDAKWLGGSVSR